MKDMKQQFNMMMSEDMTSAAAQNDQFDTNNFNQLTN